MSLVSKGVQEAKLSIFAARDVIVHISQNSARLVDISQNFARRVESDSVRLLQVVDFTRFPATYTACTEDK